VLADQRGAGGAVAHPVHELTEARPERRAANFSGYSKGGQD